MKTTILVEALHKVMRHRLWFCDMIWVVADAFAEAGKDFGVEVGMATPDDIWSFVIKNTDKYKEIHPLKLLSQE